MRGCSFEAERGEKFIHVFPAYAGMFRNRPPHHPTGSGFPRVCGDVPYTTTPQHSPPKFSPRMRGCSVEPVHPLIINEVFPAYAGMFQGNELTQVMGSLFSPRMRGCSSRCTKFPPGSRVFPAYAGMFHPQPITAGRSRGFPRVCGDVPPPKKPYRQPVRFSPRMRGCSDHKILA